MKEAAHEPSDDQKQPGPGNPYLAGFLAWLIPGAGHFYLGRRGRAAIFLAVVTAALILGWGLDGNLYRAEMARPLILLATGACLGTGLPYLVLLFVSGYTGDPTAPGYEYGTAFLLSAGLINLLLVLDAWDIAHGKKD